MKIKNTVSIVALAVLGLFSVGCGDDPVATTVFCANVNKAGKPLKETSVTFELTWTAGGRVQTRPAAASTDVAGYVCLNAFVGYVEDHNDFKIKNLTVTDDTGAGGKCDPNPSYDKDTSTLYIDATCEIDGDTVADAYLDLKVKSRWARNRASRALREGISSRAERGESHFGDEAPRNDRRAEHSAEAAI